MGYTETSTLTNIFAGKEFVPTTAGQAGVINETWAPSSQYGYATLTDGIFSESNGRFSTWMYNGSHSTVIEATLDLGRNYMLSHMKIWVYKQNINFVGKDFKVEALVNGAWVEVASYTSSNIEQYIVSEGTGDTDGYILLDLGDVVASKVRIYSSGAIEKTNNSTSFYEIECFGELA